MTLLIDKIPSARHMVCHQKIADRHRESRVDDRESWRGTQGFQRSMLIEQRFSERHTRTSAEYARHVILTFFKCLAYRTI